MSEISFKLRATRSESGVHTQVTVFAGRTPGSRGHTGTLSFRNEEWDALRKLLEGRPGVEIEERDR